VDGMGVCTRNYHAYLSAYNVRIQCEAYGAKTKSQLAKILAVKKGSHFMNLSGIGFHSAVSGGYFLCTRLASREGT